MSHFHQGDNSYYNDSSNKQDGASTYVGPNGVYHTEPASFNNSYKTSPQREKEKFSNSKLLESQVGVIKKAEKSKALEIAVKKSAEYFMNKKDVTFRFLLTSGLLSAKLAMKELGYTVDNNDCKQEELPTENLLKSLPPKRLETVASPQLLTNIWLECNQQYRIAKDHLRIVKHNSKNLKELNQNVKGTGDSLNMVQKHIAKFDHAARKFSILFENEKDRDLLFEQ